MPKKKPSALEALAQHDRERRTFEDRGAEIRRAAALEIGFAVLDAGGGALTSSELAAAMKAALRQCRGAGQAPVNESRSRVSPAADTRSAAPSEGEEHHG